MNRLQRSVAYKREKRKQLELEQEKLKQEPKVDMFVEGLGWAFAIGGVIALFKILL